VYYEYIGEWICVNVCACPVALSIAMYIGRHVDKSIHIVICMW